MFQGLKGKIVMMSEETGILNIDMEVIKRTKWKNLELKKITSEI